MGGKGKKRKQHQLNAIKAHDAPSRIQKLGGKGQPSSQLTPADTDPGPGQSSGCPHLQKSVRYANLKNLKSSTQLVCKECSFLVDAPKHELEDVWLCLHCAKMGCGRACPHAHAVKHYDQVRSHTVALNLSTYEAWCYACDEAVEVQAGSNLEACILHVKRCQGKVPKVDVPLYGSKKVKEAAPPLALPGIPTRGLMNCGNTCYFNSILQCLNQTPLFHHHMESPPAAGASVVLSLPDQSPLTVKLESGVGDLTKAMGSLLANFKDSARCKAPIAPSYLLREVERIARRFSGGRQHDSQELMRVLLDGIHNEEAKRMKSAVLKSLDLVGAKPASVPPEKKAVVSAYGNLIEKKTFVDAIFGGSVASTVTCLSCMTTSRKLEHFMDLSLPLPEEQAPIRGKVYARKPARSKYSDPATPDSDVADFLADLGEALGSTPKAKPVGSSVKGAVRNGKPQGTAVGKKKNQKQLKRETKQLNRQARRLAKQKTSRPTGSAAGQKKPESESESEEEGEEKEEVVKDCWLDDEEEANLDPSANVNAIGCSNTKAAVCEPVNGLTPPESPRTPCEAVAVNGEGSRSLHAMNPTGSGNGVELAPHINDRPGNGVELAPQPDNGVELTSHINDQPGNSVELASHTNDCSGNSEELAPQPGNGVELASHIIDQPGNGVELASHTNDCSGNGVELASHTNDCSGNGEELAPQPGNGEELAPQPYNGVELASHINDCSGNGEELAPQPGNGEELAPQPDNGVELASQPDNGVELASHINDQPGNGVELASHTNDCSGNGVELASHTNDCSGNGEELAPQPGNGEELAPQPYNGVELASHINDQPGNGVELASHTNDCSGNGVELASHTNDCSGNGVELASHTNDCSGNGVELASHTSDCSGNGEELAPQPNNSVELASHTNDCSGNGVELASHTNDCSGNGVELAPHINDQPSNSSTRTPVDRSSNNVFNGVEEVHRVNPTNISNDSSINPCDPSIDSTSNLVSNRGNNSTSDPAASNGHPAPAPAANSAKSNAVTQALKLDGFGSKSVSQPRLNEWSLEASLFRFTEPEVLDGDNKYQCDTCTKSKRAASKNGEEEKPVYSVAAKQVSVQSLPPVLTLHVKRFRQTVKGRSVKIDKHVVFPVLLDMKPYCGNSDVVHADVNNNIMYSLFAVAVHSGSTSHGHHVAYVKSRCSMPLYGAAANVPSASDASPPTPSSVGSGLSGGNEECCSKEVSTMESDSDHSSPEDFKRTPAHVPEIDETPPTSRPSVPLPPPAGQWLYCSDAYVKPVSEEEVLRSQAYVLFYERLPLS